MTDASGGIARAERVSQRGALQAGTVTVPGAFTIDAGGSGSGEVLRADVAPGTHFEVTQRAPITFTALYNVSQRFVAVAGLIGNRGLNVSIDHPELSTPTPYTLTTSPTTLDGPYASATYGDGQGSVYQAGLGSDFTVTVTSYSDAVLEMDFSGTLSKLAGPGASSVTLNSGHARVELDIVP